VQNLADAKLSHDLVESGIGYEGNPFLQNVVGQSSFFTLKIAGVLLCVLLLLDISRRNKKLATITICFFIGLYSLILFWNASLFLLARLWG
jgi:hypothetical protein